jgi:signal peptidase I
MIRRLVAVAVIALVVLGVAVVVTSHLYRIPASSMEPTLHCARPQPGCLASRADRIVVPRLFLRHPKRGDVVAFRTPPLARVRCGSGGVFVKRVIAVGGDTFEERRGIVFVDGRRLAEPYVARPRRDRQTYRRRRVPPDAYFVLGDNRAQSCDSRIWGPVPQRDVVGRVVATYWPPGRIGFR